MYSQIVHTSVCEIRFTTHCKINLNKHQCTVNLYTHLCHSLLLQFIAKSNSRTYNYLYANFCLIFKNKLIWWGESLTINLKTVDTPVLTMLNIKFLNVVTPYMHFTMHNPSHFYKKSDKKTSLKKKWFAIQITIVICICWCWHSWCARPGR